MAYFRLNSFIKMGAQRAPTAAPIGSPPINPPIVLALPAAFPKYTLRVFG